MLPLGGSGMLTSTLAWLGLPLAVAGTVAVAPLMPPRVLSSASTAVTKYFDLIAAHSNGPLTVLGCPGFRPEKSVRSVSLCLVTGPARDGFVGVGFGVRDGGPHPTRSSPRSVHARGPAPPPRSGNHRGGNCRSDRR